MRRKTAPKDPVHPEVSRAVGSEVGEGGPRGTRAPALESGSQCGGAK